MLYIVSTPIGNLEDISLRSLRILKEADMIIAEDTRRIRKILARYNIRNKLTSYHEYSTEKKEERIISLLEKSDIALVSDSGTPLLSDPGYRLVRKAVEKKINIVPVPGPTALIAGLVASGFATDKFCFMGFVPKKKSAKFFEEIKKSNITSIVFESPHRIRKTLEKFNEVMPEREICIAREITKMHEQFMRGKPRELIQNLGKKEIKGEITLVIQKPLS